MKKIAPTTLGRYKVRYEKVKATHMSKGMSEADATAKVEARMTEDALVEGVSLDNFKKQLASVKVKSTGSIGIAKEAFREHFNSLLDNLLFAINATSDKRVATALNALMEYDTQYQTLTGVKDSDRDDWRGLIVVAPFHADTTKLARWVGGWRDGSKNDRNQYSSGRRVPVAKSTGYTKEQKLPEKTS